MIRLLWIAAGFLLGVVVSRNAAPISAPDLGAVVVGIGLVAWLAFFAGKRDKRQAVATAVATAVASAEAHAQAQAEAAAVAIAQQAVNLHLSLPGYAAAVGEAKPAEVAAPEIARALQAAGFVLPAGYSMPQLRQHG